MELHIHRHIIDENTDQLFIFDTSNPFKKSQIYRSWARNESIMWRLKVLTQLIQIQKEKEKTLFSKIKKKLICCISNLFN